MTRSMFEQLTTYLRFTAGFGPFLRRTVSLAEARAQIARRLETRGDRLLRLLSRAVFDSPQSPYLPLLRRAGCQYGDAVDGVRRWGVDGFLQRLLDEGVSVDFRTFKAQADRFANPLVGSGFEVRTGGSTGQATRAKLNLGLLANRACYDHLMFSMLRLHNVPLALWFPRLPAATGISNLLRYAKIGQPPCQWFALLADRDVRPGLESRAAMTFALVASRLARRPLPWPKAAGFDRVDLIVDWIVATKASSPRCAVQGYTSLALRVCRRAIDRRIDLQGTCFIVGSEPLTAAKQQEIEASGATVYDRYFSTETSGIAYGCGEASEVGDLHLLSAELGVAQRTPAGPLYFTSLSHDAPKLMINVQLGDAATVERRACGCVFGQLGLDTHLRRIRSLEAITCEGQLVPIRQLEQLSDLVFPARYGGSSLDYQWVEQEDAGGQSRLCLRVDPRLGKVDETAIVAAVIELLAGGDRGQRLAAETWRRAGTVRVMRQRPETTVRGKQHAVLLERPTRSSGGQ